MQQTQDYLIKLLAIFIFDMVIFGQLYVMDIWPEELFVEFYLI